ncbi:MAG: ATP-binding cassette domain-containing protein [Bacteroidales bacterium]|nr:ATP-binding cassette domain-containing protein [Candidatus Cryptobacteroides fimicaballi]
MIEIKDLAFSYGSSNVLRNITMKLEAGKIYGLLGENGVGKTTLLTLLCGLKKLQTGSIDIDGYNPYERNPLFLEELFYLPDEVAPVNDRAIRWARETGKFWPEFSLDKFDSLMSLFEVDSSLRMTKMSAGMLKKTYICFALACGTRYLFMDEPTNGLDIPSKAQFRSALLKYTREDSTIVISTHQVRDLENVIDPIIILDTRDVLLNASIEEISSALYFDYSQTLHPDSLYSEQIPGGFIQVRPNTSALESKVNIEALFNAAHRNKALIKDIFKPL